VQFDFGQNWLDFSEKALSNNKATQAKADFKNLMIDIPLTEKSFLDIGFGQGLSLLSAVEIGAKVVGCDINPKCTEVLKQNIKYFPKAVNANIKTFTGSILDNPTIEKLRKDEPDGQGCYDVVHSWGALHHTGNMKRAIINAASLVKHDGILVLALYNRHWSSPIWLAIKWIYCKSPEFVQRVMILALYPIIWFAKLMITGKSPREQTRGMDFFHNVIDWVGGYPYEYADTRTIQYFIEDLGFKLIKINPSTVPTGCNEFIFTKTRKSIK
jgi:2-polyprenyl-6-hydroxyphenyl methylase/3-demethylubiquinone-9 3-methyltransferase